MSKISEIDIEQKMDKLDRVVDWFNSDEFKLSQATARFKEATNLVKQIDDDLNGIKNEINIIKKRFDK